MVLREKRISNKSDNVQLSVSYGIADVKSWLRLYVSPDGVCEEVFRTCPLTEQDIRFFLEHHASAFASYPEKWREQLSGWAFAVAVRHGLLKPVATDENRYYFADCLFAKRGRPKNDD